MGLVQKEYAVFVKAPVVPYEPLHIRVVPMPHLSRGGVLVELPCRIVMHGAGTVLLVVRPSGRTYLEVKVLYGP